MSLNEPSAGTSDENTARRMQRRLQNASEESEASITPSLQQLVRTAVAVQDQLSEQLEQQLTVRERENPMLALSRLLSTSTAVSTSSTLASRYQAALGSDANFREIGTGSIGRVYEQAGTVYVLKVGITDERDLRIWNNYLQHLKIAEGFAECPVGVNVVEVPHCYWYTTADESNEFWRNSLRKFPQTPHDRRIGPVYCLERIFPVPKIIREKLIELYCAPELAEQAHTNTKNKDCLMRVLLGKRRPGPPGRFFNLRNFRLFLNQMEDMDLDVVEYAHAMADTMAILHWKVKVDGNDIEFVLGSSPTEMQTVRRDVKTFDTDPTQPVSTYEHVTNNQANFKRRTVKLWVIDFDACHDLPVNSSGNVTEGGIQSMIKAFQENDPYCPRPHREVESDNKLWDTFAKRYIQTGSLFDPDGPAKFVQGVERLFLGIKLRSGSSSQSPSSRTPRPSTTPRPGPLSASYRGPGSPDVNQTLTGSPTRSVFGSRPDEHGSPRRLGTPPAWTGQHGGPPGMGSGSPNWRGAPPAEPSSSRDDFGGRSRGGSRGRSRGRSGWRGGRGASHGSNQG